MNDPMTNHIEVLRGLVATAKEVVDWTPEQQRESYSCHAGIVSARNCARCGPQLRLMEAITAADAALAAMGGEQEQAQQQQEKQ